MIFVTVGAQMPFDRLVGTVDDWAQAHGRKDVFAQIGRTDYEPSFIRWTPFLSPPEFKQHYEAARIVIAHAGTGSIITALQLGKPIIIMPRRASMRETRNDHQVATAKRFDRFDNVTVAWDEAQLATGLDEANYHSTGQILGMDASAELVATIRSFVNGVDVCQ